jgi:hypothetical protein
LVLVGLDSRRRRRAESGTGPRGVGGDGDGEGGEDGEQAPVVAAVVEISGPAEDSGRPATRLMSLYDRPAPAGRRGASCGLGGGCDGEAVAEVEAVSGRAAAVGCDGVYAAVAYTTGGGTGGGGGGGGGIGLWNLRTAGLVGLIR